MDMISCSIAVLLVGLSLGLVKGASDIFLVQLLRVYVLVVMGKVLSNREVIIKHSPIHIPS